MKPLRSIARPGSFLSHEGDAVVVTGVGTLGAFGSGLPALHAALLAGEVSRTEVARAGGYHRLDAAGRRSSWAALTPEAAVSAVVSAGEARRMSWPSRLAVAAGRLALADAGMSADPSALEDAGRTTATVVANAFGPAGYTERLLHSIQHLGPEQASPAVFTESVASAAASQLAIQTRSLGPCLTITQREAGLLQAVHEGARLVASGRARRALVGGVEEVTPLLHSILDRFRALSAGPARPFDRRRDGFMAADGATILVLERESAARERGARVRARILAAGSAFDATSPPYGWGSGVSRLARGFRSGFEGARLATEPGLSAFRLVVSGANGAIVGDRLEADLLTDLSAGSEALPGWIAPKGVVGEYGGAFLAASVLAAMEGAVVFPASDFEPEAGFALVAARPGPAPQPGDLTLVTTCAAGGAASWLVLQTAD